MAFHNPTEVTTTDPAKVLCPLPIVPRPISLLEYSDLSGYSESDDDDKYDNACDTVQFALKSLGIDNVSRSDLLASPESDPEPHQPQLQPQSRSVVVSHTPDTPRNSVIDDDKLAASIDARLQKIVCSEVAWSKLFVSAGTNMPVDVDVSMIPDSPHDKQSPERFLHSVVDVDRILNYQKLYEHVHLEPSHAYTTIAGQQWVPHHNYRHDPASFMWASECDGITWVNPQDRFVVVPATTKEHIDIAITHQCWTSGSSTNTLLNHIYQQSVANGARTWMFVSNPNDATIRGIGEMVSPIDPCACMAEFGSALVGSGRVKWHSTAVVGGSWLDGLTTEQGTSLTMSGPPAELDWLTAREVINLFSPE